MALIMNVFTEDLRNQLFEARIRQEEIWGKGTHEARGLVPQFRALFAGVGLCGHIVEVR
jgi:hypothetical protein